MTNRGSYTMNEPGNKACSVTEVLPDQVVADAMAVKRRDLIAQPLERIWPDLARAAIAAMPGEPVAWRWRFDGDDEAAWGLRKSRPPHADDADVECQALYAAPAMPGWQPIETAPKDGDEVLIAEGKVRGEAYFDSEENRWYWANTGRGDYPDPHEPFPTHWMPLPTPPEVQS